MYQTAVDTNALIRCTAPSPSNGDAGVPPISCVNLLPGTYTGTPVGVNLQGSYVYWADSTLGTIGRLATTQATAPTSINPLISSQAGAYGITSDATYLYWTDSTAPER